MKKKVFTKVVVLMMSATALEYFGWGFTDAFFSIYVDNIVNNVLYVGLIFALISFISLISTIIISQIISECSTRSLAIAGKFLYLFVVIFYILAGIYMSAPLLIIAVICNGVTRSMRNVSEQDFLIERSDKEHASRILGVDFALKNTLWIIAIAISGFILIFIAEKTGQNHKDVIYYLFYPVLLMLLIGILLLKQIKPHGKSNAKQVKSAIFNIKTFTKFFKNIPSLSPTLLFAIFLFFILSILQGMTLIFVPLLALELNLGFWQIGILIALLYVPIIFSFAFSILADKIDRLNIVIFGLIFSLFPLIFLSFTKAPLYIGIFSALISFSVSMIRPATLGIIASLSSAEEKAHMAGFEEFFSQSGLIFSSIILGIMAQYFGIEVVFLVMALMAVVFAIFAIHVKIKVHKKNEHHLHNKKIEKHHYFHIPHPYHG